MEKRFTLIYFLPVILAVVTMTGCQDGKYGVPLAAIPERQTVTKKITLGAVQRQIKPGVTSAEVVDILGSPNIVTSGEDSSETWVYDKIYAEEEEVQSKEAKVSVRATRTMIVLIKFDRDSRVKNISYRQTSY